MDPGKVFTVTGTNTVNGATNGFGGIPVKSCGRQNFVFGYNSYDSTPALGSRNESFVAVYSSNGALQNIASLVDTSGNPTNGYGTTRILTATSSRSNGILSRSLSGNPRVFKSAAFSPSR
ncbi:MAG: hypothetical protein IPN51_13240 [Chloracidobacterium sp.]|nr:hypothetical protein [Chloracidobacterium sp.]